MKNFFVLRVLDHFRAIFEKFGIDYPMMRIILQVKLTMDGRNVPAVINREKKRQDSNNNFAYSLILYVVYSVILIPFVMAGQNYIVQMSIVFGIFIFIMMTSLISDFSAVLLDIRDKNIIAPRPVDHKTRNAAKMIHICIYLFSLTIAFTALPLIIALVKNGILFFLIFAAEIVLADLFIVVLTGLVYLVILRFFDGEKLKDIINAVQIILALVTAVGYQFVGQVFRITLDGAVFTPKWWQFFIVPVWFGAPFEVFLKGNKNNSYLAFSLLAILVPAVCIGIYVKCIPSFERNIQKLNNHSGQKKGSNDNFLEKVAQVVCWSKEEQVFFKFAVNLMKNEREFKLKIYPSIGLMLALPVIFLFRIFNIDDLGHMTNSKWIFVIYYCALTLPVIIMTMKYSANYKGAWIYKACPVQSTAPIYKGTFKAIYYKLFGPLYLLECMAFLIIFGIGSLVTLIAMLLNIILFTIICYRIIQPELPFSEAAGETEGAGLILIPLFLILSALGGIHMLSSLIWFGPYLDMAVVAVACIVMWKTTFSARQMRIS
jgi:hypothetical protein